MLARARALGGGTGFDFAPLFAPVRRHVAGADLAICHLETPITGAEPSGYPPFSAPPALARGIAATGWDACSTASNHSLDRGRAGIAATARALDAAGVRHTGMFATASARRRPLVLRAGGARIALLSYTTNTNGRPLPAPHSVNVAWDPRRVVADARRARRRGADAVLVNVHWTAQPLLWTPDLAIPGAQPLVPEYVSRPSPAQEAFVAALLRSRAVAAVVGQGPHVVQPMRRVAGRYAIFSEGNLVSGRNPRRVRSPAAHDGLIALLVIELRRGRAEVRSIRYVPIRVDLPSHLVVPAAPGSGSYSRTVSVAGGERGVGVWGGG